jgi:hypothetical protein
MQSTPNTVIAALLALMAVLSGGSAVADTYRDCASDSRLVAPCFIVRGRLSVWKERHA